ncbi:hypothetical protein TNIN_287961 [Trichonephila inaurata madagascariensis]|uniref:Uncharacterized protein n=1 Tax=Trichonephila inaurata madagascariensis TaxID=2747483 RepID=A0A8X6YB28_9ARAC|nr:hypothetical protein TNIN_287961 [Trichonephila inaurata madagascariensis]
MSSRKIDIRDWEIYGIYGRNVRLVATRTGTTHDVTAIGSRNGILLSPHPASPGFRWVPNATSKPIILQSAVVPRWVKSETRTATGAVLSLLLGPTFIRPMHILINPVKRTQLLSHCPPVGPLFCAKVRDSGLPDSLATDKICIFLEWTLLLIELLIYRSAVIPLLAVVCSLEKVSVVLIP